jgi:hypothetical protein
MQKARQDEAGLISGGDRRLAQQFLDKMSKNSNPLDEKARQGARVSQIFRDRRYGGGIVPRLLQSSPAVEVSAMLKATPTSV